MDDETISFRITEHGWKQMIRVLSYALDIPAPSTEVLNKMTYSQLLIKGKELANRVDVGNVEQQKRAAYAMEYELTGEAPDASDG